jgi:murein DD-endopeptidase MepM/ murein hydrolase activator NlpD
MSSQSQIDDYISSKFESDSTIALNPINFINPISKKHFYISQGFIGDHRGIDIVTEKRANVHASYSGRVLHIGDDDVYGKIIILAHKDNFYTFYGHLDSIFVKKHNFIKNNEVIGLVGETGQTSGPHLHFEIWNDWKISDPRLLINELKERDVTQ